MPFKQPDTKRPRGRPPLDADDPSSVHVHVRLPTKQYDLACKQADADRVSVPELLRRALRRAGKL